MLPLNRFPLQVRRQVRGLFTDIDDTLTTDGRLTADAYGAMERLRAAGVMVIPITGRPAGWCDHIARMWPVDGVVGENGAFHFRFLSEERRLVKRYLLTEPQRAENRRRLDALCERVLAEVPGTAVASDQPYRETDLAIDFREDVEPLPVSEAQRVVDILEQAGATAKISSIHVNAWFGTNDKLTMTRTMLDECFGIDLDAEKERFVFIGDSPNDAPMFAYFPNSVGVANVREFEDRLASPPTYVTEGRAGEGFAELAQALIEAR